MKIKVALLSSGLGNIFRGFEISAAKWYDEIEKNQELLVKLYAGGNQNNAIKIWNLSRNGKIASFLRYFKLIKDGCRLEQITFAVSFFFHILYFRPHIIWLQEGTLGNMLISYRKVFGFRYKLVFCDGAAIGHNFEKRFDYMIFLHQYALEEAIKDGINKSRCCVIPHITMFPDNKV